MSNSRKFDVVLYGASGFVGRQTVDYFVTHGEGLSWALAGRNGDKLASVREAAGAGAGNADIIVAAAADDQALDSLAGSTRVVLSTAGPFADYGSGLVAACVRQGTHYVDITGETPWVRDLIDRHHEQAAADGTRIIPCCGFDSVPSDLGAWLLVDAMKEHHGETCANVKACFSMRGGLNGGTLASLLNIVNSGRLLAVADPFLLNPEGLRPPTLLAHADPIVPHYDGEFEAWVGPFVMGPINSRVVRRSAALLDYGSDFHYQEFMHLGGNLATGAVEAVKSAGVLDMLRELATRIAPRPGEGPSEETMDRGYFKCELVARSASGKAVHGRLADHGDPGNRATTKFVCEAALTLALNEAELPHQQNGGVLTPASGLGTAFAKRLRAAGMEIEVTA